MFVRVQTGAGAPAEKLTVPGRFNDADVVHVVSQNLEIQGTPGGPILEDTRPDIALLIVGPLNTPAELWPQGVTIIGWSTSIPTASKVLHLWPQTMPQSPAVVTMGLLISGIPAAPSRYVGRRLYRSEGTGTGVYTLVAELGRSEPAVLDTGATLSRVLDTTVTSRNRARFDARLSIDPGVVVKLEGSRIEAEVGAQFIAEGQPGREIIFTSRLDDRYGAGGTFDTNNDGDLVTPQFAFLEDDFESGSFAPALWNTGSTTATVDAAGLSESSGTLSAHIQAGGILQTAAQNLNGEPDVEIQYTFQRTGSGTSPGSSGELRLEYRDSGGTWRLADLQSGNGADMTSFQAASVRLPAAALHFNSAFRFRNLSGVGDWFVDDVAIAGSPVRTICQRLATGAGFISGILGRAVSIRHSSHTVVELFPSETILPASTRLKSIRRPHVSRIRSLRKTLLGQGAVLRPVGPVCFSNASGTIFVRGAQPIVLSNEFRDNEGAVISINANSLNSDLVDDTGRSTGIADLYTDVAGNQGPLIDNNRLGGNAINGMVVRPATLTTQGVWDDTDIVHVLQNDILIPDFHTYGGLRLESSSVASLVVKLQGADAGFTANGYPIDIDDRIGGSLQIIGQPGQPVILTSLSDDSVGAGFDLVGLPLRDTNDDGPSTGSPSDWRSVRIAEYAHDANIQAIVENESADPNSADHNNTIKRLR